MAYLAEISRVILSFIYFTLSAYLQFFFFLSFFLLGSSALELSQDLILYTVV